MRIARAAFFALVLVACSTDPHREPMPADLQNADSNESFKAAVAKLPENEKELLAGYMIRASLALSPEQRSKTIGEAIDAQRSFLSAKEAEERKQAEEQKRATADALKTADAARAADRKAMLEAVAIDVTSVSLPPRDMAKKQFGNELIVSLVVKNTGKKPITRLSGWLDATDGKTTRRTLSAANIPGPIAAGETREWKGAVPIDAPRDPFAPTSAKWIPYEYGLDDGTKLWWGPP